jgi:hypothetical protein
VFAGHLAAERLRALRTGMSAGDLAAVLHVHPSTLTGFYDSSHNGGCRASKIQATADAPCCA